MRPDLPQEELFFEAQAPQSWWRRLLDWLMMPLRPVPRAAVPALPLPARRPSTPPEPEDVYLSTQVLQQLADRLALEEVEPLVAHHLMLEVVKSLPQERWSDPVVVFGEAARVLMGWCPVTGPLRIKKGALTVVALVGPTGVGKTTMLAKLASLAAHVDKHSVGLITCDVYRIAAVEQVRAYARLLELPMAVARSREELEEALRAYAHMDLVFVDTAGQSPNELERLLELESLVGGAERMRRLLVLSATTKHSDIHDIIQRFDGVGYDALVINKLDESRSHGVLLNAAVASRRPVAYLGIGQNVPQDLEVASRERIADLLLDLSHHFMTEMEDDSA